MSLLIIIWITANYFTNHHVSDLALTDTANRLAYVGGFGVVLAGLLFSYHFPVKRRTRAIEKVIIILVSLVGLAVSATDSVTGHVILDAQGNLGYTNGSLLWLYLLFFIIPLIFITRNLLDVPRVEGVAKQRQAHLVLFAFITSASLGVVINVILPAVGLGWDATRFGPLATIVLVAAIAYTIIRHGLFDIRLAVVRAMTYILSLVTLAAVYYAVAYTISRTLLMGNAAYVSLGPLNVALALLLAFIFQPVKRFFDKLTNSIFYRDNYNVDDFFARLSRELSATTELRDLLKRAAYEISNTLKAEYTLFFMQYGNGKHLTVGTPHTNSIGSSDVMKLDDLRAHSQDLIVAETLDEEDPLYRLLKKHDIAIALPLDHPDGAMGYLFLGEGRGREYTKRDVRALETISDELIIATQNALSVQEVREINATLQQRIEDATKELRQSNQQLQRLDEAKDEFVSMASHQLRTPLTSVKGYISMVLEGDVGKITAMQRQLLEEAFTSSERMVHLINDFLNVSRLQTGKFVLEEKAVNLAKVIDREVEGLQTTAKAHGLKLHYHKPGYFPVLYLDESKIQQVLMNFIDNAIYYSHEGTTIEVSLAVEEGYAVLKVNDTGIGVPKSEQAHLFTKFYRASNARKQRPDGTGVGLFLAKKVISAHGGTIVFESEEGKGSTFGFRLPIKKLSSPSTNETDQLEK